MTPLHYLSVSEIRSLFESRALSPVELMEAVIRRAEQVEPHLNAFIDTYFDQALEQAARAEQRFARKRARVLEGLPLAVKDDTPIKGKRTTTGSLLYRDHIDGATNPSVERLINAGAIVHARTACPEFCWAWICDSRINGLTRNPWNLAMTPGGSSGGSASALAAGSTVLATGTDSAGSIRQPAALCSVVGFKPPYGRNPWSPWNNLDMYNQIGPMTRSVDECIMMQNVMAGPHRSDHATVRPKLRLARDYAPVKGLKIAYSIDLGCYEVSDPVRRNTLECLNVLSSAGAQVAEVALPWVERALRAGEKHGAQIYGPMFADALRAHRDELCDYTVYFAESMSEPDPRAIHEAYRAASEAWLSCGPLLETYDAFICPTVSTPRMPAALRPWERFEVNGRSVNANGGWVLTPLFNMFSRCPVLAIPSGFTPDGLPTGIQVVARTFDDKRVFRVAKAIETLRPWADSHPEIGELA